MSYRVVNGTHVVISAELAVLPDAVFDAFTNPSVATGWMWGAGAADPQAVMDVRVGGRYRISIQAPDAERDRWPSDRWGFSGLYIDVSPPSRLVYTIHWEGPVGYNETGEDIADEVAIVTIEPSEDGSVLQLDHIGIPDDLEAADIHGRSIDATFRDLRRLLEG